MNKQGYSLRILGYSTCQGMPVRVQQTPYKGGFTPWSGAHGILGFYACLGCSAKMTGVCESALVTVFAASVVLFTLAVLGERETITVRSRMFFAVPFFFCRTYCEYIYISDNNLDIRRLVMRSYDFLGSADKKLGIRGFIIRGSAFWLGLLRINI